MDKDMEEIGRLVRNRRLELGMTVYELAEKSGYKSPTAISKIENGVRNITMSKLPSLAAALKVDISYFFTNLEDTEEDKNLVFLIETYNKMTDNEKEHIINYMKFLNQNTEEGK